MLTFLPSGYLFICFLSTAVFRSPHPLFSALSDVDAPLSPLWANGNGLRVLILGLEYTACQLSPTWSPRLSTPSKNGLMPLPGVSPHKWHIRGRAEYFCSCSPATWLLQDSHIRRTLPSSICSSRLVSSRYFLKQ